LALKDCWKNMYPQVNIKKIRDRYFNYSVGIANAEGRYVGHGLRSIAECLHDAATALGHHFSVAAISYEGRALGCYHVANMEHKTVALAHTLLAKLALPEPPDGSATRLGNLRKNAVSV
jgi:hypothetical protein